MHQTETKDKCEYNCKRLARRDSVLSPIHRCGHCSFPKELARSNFLNDRHLCPCGLDISIQGMSNYRDAHNESVNKSGIENLSKHDVLVPINTSTNNTMEDTSVEAEYCQQEATAFVLTSAMETICNKAMKLEAQRRIDELNNALSNRTTSHFMSGAENVNNSSCSSGLFYDEDKKTSESGTLLTCQENFMPLQNAHHFCVRPNSRSLGFPQQIKYRFGPPVLENGRNGCDSQQCMSPVRYHPYLLRTHGIQKRNSKIRKKHKILLSRHGRHNDKNEIFPPNEYNVYPRNVISYVHGGRLISNRHHCKTGRGLLRRVCTEKVVSLWDRFPRTARWEYVHQQHTSRGRNHFERMFCDTFLLAHYRESTPNLHQQGAVRVACEGDDGRFSSQGFQHNPSFRPMEVDTPYHTSNPDVLRSGPAEHSKENAFPLETTNRKVSSNCGESNSVLGHSFSQAVKHEKKTNMTQACPEQTDPFWLCSGTNSFGDANLRLNQDQTVFTFSEPLVALSKSAGEKETVVPFFRVPRSTERNFLCTINSGLHGLGGLISHVFLSQSETSKKQYLLNNEEMAPLIQKSNACLCANSIKQRHKDFHMASATLPRDHAIEEHRISTTDCTVGKVNDLRTSKGQTRVNVCDNQGDPNQNLYNNTVACSDGDGTSNYSNNNDTARPINNNSTSQQSSAQLGGRVVKVEGDGRCLFRSLVTADHAPLQLSWRDEFGRPVNRDLAELETTRADELRSRVVAIMSDNMHFYSQLERGIINADQPSDGNYQRFLDRLRAMSEPSTMPGDLELNAVAMVMERQILVLDTNLAIITSYGHDRFPQSVPLAVRYTRLVADVGHYDAVILCDDHLAAGTRSIGHLGPYQGSPAHESSGHSGLCGQFRKLTTSGEGQNSTHQSNMSSLCSRGGFNGDATLNAKKEFFYLRDSDKSLHSDGLQPVASITDKMSVKAPKEQRTAEAATSTARATVHWPVLPNLKCRATRRRKKRRTFLDKFTQTENGEAVWKNHYYQYRYGLCKPCKPKDKRKCRIGFAYLSGSKKSRRKMFVRKSDIRGININCNSRVKNIVDAIPPAHKNRELKHEVDYEVRDERFKSLKNGKKRKCTDNFGKITKETFYSLKNVCTLSGDGSHSRAERNGNNSKNKRYTHSLRLEKLGVFDGSKKSKRKNPTTFVNVCSPNKPPKPVKPEVTRPRAATPCISSRRRKSTVERNRNRRKRSQTLSPVSGRSPPVLSKKPRLPDAFEPAQCRCVLCNTKIEPSARESAKCFMCGRMAHRACVLKESSSGGLGGGDQNYFICKFCVAF